MKLGESKNIISSIEVQLEGNVAALKFAPLDILPQILDHCNGLLEQKNTLLTAIRKTEEATIAAGNLFLDVVQAHIILCQKIKLLESLEVRTDLDPRQIEGLIKQLEEFRSNRDTLKEVIDGCLWETDLLVD